MWIIIMVFCAALAVYMGVKFNHMMVKSYGKSVISYGFAAASGAAGLVTYVCYNDKDGWMIPLIITVIISVIAVVKCRKKALEVTGDEALAKKAAFIQFIMPFGVIIVLLVLSASSNTKNRKKRD